MELFYQGNFIPDMVINKSITHMYNQDKSGILVPDIDKIFYICKPHFDKKIVIGIYSHLYLDYKFLKEYLIPLFDFDISSNIITNRKTGDIFTKEEFFCSKNTGLYGAYSSINPMLIQDAKLDINNLPNRLEKSGIDIYDLNRSKTTLKEELDGYLAQNIPYTGNILNYNELTDKIKKFAIDFITNFKYK